jgi:hypothetical protein
MVNDTVPEPLPGVPAVTWMNDAAVEALQAQPVAADTASL